MKGKKDKNDTEQQIETAWPGGLWKQETKQTGDALKLTSVLRWNRTMISLRIANYKNAKKVE